MPETCARCGHTSGGCQRCGRYDEELGANINGFGYCHNEGSTTCYMATSQVPVECVTCYCLNDTSHPDCLCHCHPGNRDTGTDA